MKRKTNLYNII